MVKAKTFLYKKIGRGADLNIFAERDESIVRLRMQDRDGNVAVAKLEPEQAVCLAGDLLRSSFNAAGGEVGIEFDALVYGLAAIIWERENGA